MKHHLLHKFSLLFLVIFALYSCTESSFYEKAYSFKDNNWNEGVKPVFKVEIKDTSKFYDFTLTLRVTTDYAYSNCWMYLNTTAPNKVKGREPFEMKITNPDGTWVGNKTGTIVENLLLFKRRKFPLPGVYFFRVEQAVIQENLGEVLDVGLRIEEVKN